MTIKWNNAQAWQEGWDVFDTGHSIEILHIDTPWEFAGGLGYDDPKFDSDEAAAAFVTERANAGSKYHKLALRFLESLRDSSSGS